MVVGWRVCKSRHAPFDGQGARLYGARWNSPGAPVIYGADSFAGAILEILVHALRPRTLPGAHHAVRVEVEDTLVEELTTSALPGWDQARSAVAREFGDRWLKERRSPALLVPSLPSRPVGRNLLINPLHPAAGSIVVSEPFAVPWDERLF
ncbi:MAG TPA: RES family NAD+ phosphorylase [Thermoanaerobaculia bacterium]|jgi:RES domain-containing protein|nr:RES family NAD+ phosphorylase [Thermoanaerobaculia bacterium]